MKLEGVLLTEKERKTLRIPYKDDDDIYSAVDRIIQYTSNAQCLKLLDVLKANMNRREVGGVYPEWALSDKFICELEKLLKEGQ